VKQDYGTVLQNYRVGKFEIKNEDGLNKDYLYHVLTSTYFLNQVFGKINQAAQPNIGKAEMEKTKIPLPPIAEQRRIVSEIQAFQTKMDALKAAQAGQLSALEGLFPGVGAGVSGGVVKGKAGCSAKKVNCFCFVILFAY
jgi:restriction endonuclease S subunit